MIDKKGAGSLLKSKLGLQVLSLILSMTVVVSVLYYLDKRAVHAHWSQDMHATVVDKKVRITQFFHEISSDVIAIVSDDSFRAQIDQHNYQPVIDRFKALLHTKMVYAQICFIDMAGMERVRVEMDGREAKVVQDAALQNKSVHDYVYYTNRLKDGSLWISAIDLNIENGVVEQPLRPMLRFSAPVFNAQGERLGLLVINYPMGDVLDEFDRSSNTKAGHLYLLNEQGFLLAGGDPATRWGHLLGHNDTMSTLEPKTWLELNQNLLLNRRAFEFDENHFVVDVLDPRDFVKQLLGYDHVPLQVASAERTWIIMDRVSEDEMYAEVTERLNMMLLFCLLVGGLLIRVLYRWHRLKIASDAAREQSQKLAQVIEQTSDIVFLTDLQGRIEYVNAAFTDVTGFTRDQVLLKKPGIFKSGRHSDDFYQNMWREISEGHTFREMFINVRSDDSLYYEEKTISPLFDSANNIIGYASIGKDITDSKVMRMAFYDQLTGLVNRALLLDRLEHKMGYAKRNRSMIALLYMDLDGFKAINDTYGHNIGDEALIEFARRVKALMRSSDTLARIGGDEFVVLLRDITEENVASFVAAKIISVISQPWNLSGHDCYLGVSIGVTYYTDQEMEPIDLLQEGDVAMYMAKRNGKNCFYNYDRNSRS
ncbi:MAG: diguanylate cyclase [Zetaproteobacteria bacterium]|nr:diguanylate cyclase [Zetaproteobacteria bacterium]